MEGFDKLKITEAEEKYVQASSIMEGYPANATLAPNALLILSGVYCGKETTVHWLRREEWISNFKALLAGEAAEWVDHEEDVWGVFSSPTIK